MTSVGKTPATFSSAAQASAPQKLSKPPLSLFASFATGSIAACTAVLYSNMAETVKTRLQLDGEGGVLPRQYRGVTDAALQIYKAEGIRGLHRGLVAALYYQTVMNGTRLGLYEPIQRVTRPILGESEVLVRLIAASTSGGLGATLASPLYLVKTRLQAEGANFHARERHGYTGMADGLFRVWKTEGFKGLFRGVSGAVPRVMVGSSAQLLSYDGSTHLLKKHLQMTPGGHSLVLTASLLSSFVTVTLMNPLDVVSSRLYQSAGKATKYNGIADCALQTLKAEGYMGFMKGWSAQFVRLMPHSVISLWTWEFLKANWPGQD
jgi:solute carrier family 25, member 34/35